MRDKNLLLTVVALLLIGGGGYAAYTMTRGLRNNNPLNIEDDGVTPWVGLDSPRSDTGPGVPKLRFLTPEYGYRAAARIVNNYVHADGVPSTITGIIRRWSKTDQAAYIDKVSRDLGIAPDAVFDLPSVIVPLFASMTAMENGVNPYSDQTIATGIGMA